MKKISRRELMKFGFIATGTALLLDKLAPLAQAADCDDSKITQQGYMSDHTKLDAKHKEYAKFSAHQKQIEAAATKAGKSTAGLHPHCANCKQYKEKATGCGTCPMVGATGTPGKMVKSTGWCRIYMADASKLK